jgi:inosose dehydratase
MAANITIATAPCSWGIWYADGRPSGTPWRVFLDGAARAGYRALELGPDGYLPRDNGELRAELASRNMTVCAGTACFQFDKYRDFGELEEQLKGLCGRIAALDAQYLVVMDESDVGERSEKKAFIDKETRLRYLDMFKDLRLWTREQWNVETVYHPHIKSLVETEEEIVEIIDFCGMKLCFDTGHHAYVNGGWEQDDPSALDFIRKYSSSIAYIHFKNVDGRIRKKVRDENLSSDTAFDLDVMCDLEKGIIDFKKLKGLLDVICYEGIGVIEMDMPHAPANTAFEAAKRNLLYLRTIGMIP